jgi:type I restriction enzyme, S subunit
MSVDLPAGWSETAVGNVARIVGGGTPPSKDPSNFAAPGQGTPWVTPADLSGYREQTISHGARDLTPAGLAACAATLMPAGTVLFSSRAPIGYVAIAANSITTNQGFKSFVLPEGMVPRYVYYQLRHLKREAEAIATGTTFKELSGAAAATLPVRVAPSREQARIADQLDTLLARINACNDRLDAIPALLKRFRQAVLDAAVSGELTEGVGTEGQVGEEVVDFATAPIGELLDQPLRNGKSVRDGDGLPVLRLSALRRSGIDLSQSKRGDWTGINAKAYLVREGDFLIARGNGSKELVGRGGLVERCEVDVAFPDTMIRLRPDPTKVHPSYLSYVWDAATVRRQIESLAHTTAGIWKVSQGDLEGIELPVPNLDTQAEIVRRVEALFALADRIEARYAAARAHAQRLTPRLLAKAFRGELVPQDPNDEPASALLARIAAKRPSAVPSTRTRLPRTPRAARVPKETAHMTKSRQDDDVKGQPYLAGHLRRLGRAATAEELFKAAELPVADFYKQLAWEVAKGHVKDGHTVLEAGDAA